MQINANFISQSPSIPDNFVRYSDAIWIADCYRASEYQTICPLLRSHLITDSNGFAIRMVPLFECPVFGSPLYVRISAYIRVRAYLVVWMKTYACYCTAKYIPNMNMNTEHLNTGFIWTGLFSVQYSNGWTIWNPVQISNGTT